MGTCCGKETVWNDMCDDCLHEYEDKMYTMCDCGGEIIANSMCTDCLDKYDAKVREEDNPGMSDFERKVFNRLSGISRLDMTPAEYEISLLMVTTGLCIWSTHPGETRLKIQK